MHRDTRSAAAETCFDFACGPPCASGQSNWRVNLQRVDTGGNRIVTGTFTRTNKNQVSLNASSSGGISVPATP